MVKKRIKENVIYSKIIEKMGHLSFMVGKDFTWFDEILQLLLKNYYIEK